MARHHGRVTLAPDPAAGERALDRLVRLVGAGGVAVLTGAGISTESGIPDYRGPNGSLSRRVPMNYQTFTGSAVAQRPRYWARSHLGWRGIACAHPNSGHHAVTALQRQGLVSGVITQNVDGLHQAAGARSVIELHGNLDRVRCLRCADTVAREVLDQRLREANPDFVARVTAVNPDGDVDIADADLGGFRVVDCQVCGGGVLKPDVVFFGETVPPQRVGHSYALVAGARLLLVLGSSLTVHSGRRFVSRAAQLGIPVVIVNQGPTRGDRYATLTVDGALGTVLPELARLTGPG